MAKFFIVGCFAGGVAAAARFGAVSAVDNGLVPRHFLDHSIPLVARDDSCPADSHPCRDIGFPSACCPNVSYCFVDRNDEPKCCRYGTSCPNNVDICERNAYRCWQTTTVTPSATRTASDADAETPSPSVTRILGCCTRSCPNDRTYKCPNDTCCGYGYDCGEGTCEKVVVLRPSESALVRPIPDGCTSADQVQCEDGQGCCDEGRVCTQVSGTGYCAIGPPTDTNVAIVDEPSNNLNDGAKAGIAIGTVFGAGIIIAALTWLCISRRRRRRMTATQQSASVAHHPIPDNMTELTASTRPPGRGLPHDYFGPDASADPHPGPSVVPTAANSPDPDHGPQPQPQSPRDVAVPVEIDSRAQSPESMTSNSHYATPMSHAFDGRYELHGAGMPPSQYVPPRQRSPSLQHTPPAMTPRDELP